MVTFLIIVLLILFIVIAYFLFRIAHAVLKIAVLFLLVSILSIAVFFILFFSNISSFAEQVDEQEAFVFLTENEKILMGFPLGEPEELFSEQTIAEYNVVFPDNRVIFSLENQAFKIFAEETDSEFSDVNLTLLLMLLERGAVTIHPEPPFLIRHIGKLPDVTVGFLARKIAEQ